MVKELQLLSVVASLVSCGFWLAGAGVRFRPLSLFKLRGPDSISAALNRQSMYNGLAAISAAVAAGSHAFISYFGH